MSEIPTSKRGEIMQNTMGIYEDRKKEINFYFSIMLDIDKGNGKIDTIDNNKFLKS